jgi:methylthioribose-1-phosphate isomerase
MEGTKVSFYEQRTIKWDRSKNTVVMIDQTVLPAELKFVECSTVPEIIDAIKTMKIRGAPAIGVAGAMGVALSIISSKSKTKSELLREIGPDSIALKSARPTAVNLSWGVERTIDFLRNELDEHFETGEHQAKVIEFVEKLADSDVEANKKLSDMGSKLFRSGESVLTHCN